MIYGQPITFGGGGGSKLPEGYTKVEYIESTGTQWIDTGYKFTSEKVQVVLDLVNTNTGSSIALCGSENDAASGTSGGNGCIVYSSSGSTKENFVVLMGDGNTGVNLTIPVDTRCLLDIAADNGALTAVLNGTSYTGTYTGYSEKVYSFALFADMKNGEAVLHSKYRLYSCKIYDNGTLVRDYVPCYDSDGVAGLYDLKNGVFYTNAGTGEFLVPSTPTPLWENAAPGSAFVAQTVELNGSNYLGFIVEFKYARDYSTYQYMYCNKDESVEIVCTQNRTASSNIAARTVSVSDSGCTFGDGKVRASSSWTQTETYAVPTRIWGMKFTL